MAQAAGRGDFDRRREFPQPRVRPSKHAIAGAPRFRRSAPDLFEILLSEIRAQVMTPRLSRVQPALPKQSASVLTASSALAHQYPDRMKNPDAEAA